MLGLSHAPESKLSERAARLSYSRAFGAAVGLLAGHRRKRMARHEVQTDVAQQSQQAQQATATEFDKFNEASSVCLERRDYLVNSRGDLKCTQNMEVKDEKNNRTVDRAGDGRRSDLCAKGHD